MGLVAAGSFNAIGLVAVSFLNAMGLVTIGPMNSMGFVAIGGVNAVGVVAIGGLNSTGIVAVEGSARSLLPVSKPRLWRPRQDAGADTSDLDPAHEGLGGARARRGAPCILAP